MATSELNLFEIKSLAADIRVLAYHTGISMPEAGAHLESKMDGTQPADFVSCAIALAERREQAIDAL